MGIITEIGIDNIYDICKCFLILLLDTYTALTNMAVIDLRQQTTPMHA
jgi:hypothetical protein